MKLNIPPNYIQNHSFLQICSLLKNIILVWEKNQILTFKLLDHDKLHAFPLTHRFIQIIIEKKSDYRTFSFWRQQWA